MPVRQNDIARRAWRHLRGNVVGYLTIFLALAGGTAYATHPGGLNTISSTDIINAEVKAPDVAATAATAEKIAPDAVNGTKIVNDSLGAADVLETSLALATDWDEVGDGDGPDFNNALDCLWENFDASHDTAAFMRDRSGTVHLKGLVRVTDADPSSFGACNFDDVHDLRVFVLPDGFRPAVRNVFPMLTSGALARLNVDGAGLAAQPPGAVSVQDLSLGQAASWVSLDGVSFRCAPSGVAGCP